MDCVLESCKEFEEALAEAHVFLWRFKRHGNVRVGMLIRMLALSNMFSISQPYVLVVPLMLWYRRVGRRCVRSAFYTSYMELGISPVLACMTLDLGAMVLRQTGKRHTLALLASPPVPARLPSLPPSIPMSAPSSSLPQPTRAYQGSSAGYDLVLENDLIVRPLESVRVTLRRPMGCPKAVYYPRSSAQKKGLHVARLLQDPAQGAAVTLELIFKAPPASPAVEAKAGDRVVQMLVMPFVPRRPGYFHVQPMGGNPGMMCHILSAAQSTYSLHAFVPPPTRRFRLNAFPTTLQMCALDPVAVNLKWDRTEEGRITIVSG